MNKKALEDLKKMLENPEKISKEQAEELLQSSFQVLSDISKIFQNPDKQEREKLLKELQEYSQNLQALSEQFKEQNGLTNEELIKLLSSFTDPSKMPEKQKKAMQEIGKTMSVFTSSLMKEITPPHQKEQSRFPQKSDIHI